MIKTPPEEPDRTTGLFYQATGGARRSPAAPWSPGCSGPGIPGPSPGAQRAQRGLHGRMELSDLERFHGFLSR